MKEKWLDIIGYEGLYQVSDLGNTRGMDRIISDKNGIRRPIKGKLLNPKNCSNGYVFQSLCKNGIKKQFLLHRLVAFHFVERITILPEVNHKDENKRNNMASNLEWCTQKYNSNFGTGIQRRVETARLNGCFKGIRNFSFGRKGYLSPVAKPVVKCDLSGTVLKEYSCGYEASRETGIGASQITGVCKNRKVTAGGFKWKYKN